MEKLICNKQRAQHIYPVLEMLNNKIKRLKMKKIEFEILEKKILKLDTRVIPGQPQFSLLDDFLLPNLVRITPDVTRAYNAMLLSKIA